MDIIAKIKENVQKLKDSGVTNNVLFANGLETCVLHFIDSDSKSLAKSHIKERNFSEAREMTMVINEDKVITKITPQGSNKNIQVIKHIDIFNSRCDGFADGQSTRTKKIKKILLKT